MLFVHIECTEEEFKKLPQLLDLAVRQAGLPVTGTVHEWVMILDRAWKNFEEIKAEAAKPKETLDISALELGKALRQDTPIGKEKITLDQVGQNDAVSNK